MACGFGIHEHDQQEVLNEMQIVISTMRVCGRKCLLPFQKGILNSISSIRGLYEEIKAEGKTFLLTAHCNSDPTENYFSCIRTMGVSNDHPGPVDCMNRIKLLVVSRDNEIVVENAAVQIESSTPEMNICESVFQQTFSGHPDVPS